MERSTECKERTHMQQGSLRLLLLPVGISAALVAALLLS